MMTPEEMVTAIIKNIRATHPSDPYYRVQVMCDDVNLWCVFDGSPLTPFPDLQNHATLECLLIATQDYRKVYSKG